MSANSPETAAANEQHAFSFTPMAENSNGLIWSDVVDQILGHEQGRSLLGVGPTHYTKSPADARDITSINGARLAQPVPVDFLNDQNPGGTIKAVQETLLDVYGIINDGVRPTSEQLRADLDQVVE